MVFFLKKLIDKDECLHPIFVMSYGATTWLLKSKYKENSSSFKEDAGFYALFGIVQ